MGSPPLYEPLLAPSVPPTTEGLVERQTQPQGGGTGPMPDSTTAGW